MVLSLRDPGVAAATGSACSSKTLEPSHTLLSCGLLHEEAHGSLEFTFGRWSTPGDVDRIMAVLPGVVARLRALSPLYKTTAPAAGRFGKASRDEIHPVHREDSGPLPQSA